MSAATSLTRSPRESLRRAVPWIVGVLVVVAAGLVAAAVQQRGAASAEWLDPASPAPTGAAAVAQVLRDQGVAVTVTTSLDDTRDELGSSPSTVLVHDRLHLLSDEQYAELRELDARLVVLEPGLSATPILDDSLALAGGVESGLVRADCTVGAATRAGEIRVDDGTGYAIVDASADVVGCFPDGDAFLLVEVRDGDDELVILGAGELLSNASIGLDGNAALVLGLLGEHDRLVWYVPGLADLPDADRLPSVDELIVPWATPLSLLAILVVIAAGIWRGRRFGPLVLERLPVTVPASETMEGRARLYARADARLHAIDTLRMAALGRLATRLGLPRSADVAEVIAAVAALTGRPPAELEQLLVTSEPHSDHELLALSDELVLLEREVADDIRPTHPKE